MSNARCGNCSYFDCKDEVEGLGICTKVNNGISETKCNSICFAFDDYTSPDCEGCDNYKPYKGACVEKEQSQVNNEYVGIKGDVIKPSHYNAGKFDVIEFCLENEVDFCRGNVIKYVVRAGKKDIHKEIEDLNKAKEYIDRIIKYIENKGE